MDPEILEEQIILNEPTASIILGGQKYGLRKLTIAKAIKWRKQFESLLELQKKAQNGAGEISLQLDMTEELLVKLSIIVSSYLGGSLTAEWILENAEEEELLEAFMAIVKHSRVPFERLGTVA